MCHEFSDSHGFIQKIGGSVYMYTRDKGMHYFMHAYMQMCWHSSGYSVVTLYLYIVTLCMIT